MKVRCEQCHRKALVGLDKKTGKYICNKCMNDDRRQKDEMDIKLEMKLVERQYLASKTGNEMGIE